MRPRPPSPRPRPCPAALAAPDFTNPAEAARAWADQHDKATALALENSILAPSLEIFEFIPGINLRVIRKGSDPWFVAKDVCDVLGYSNIPDALAKHVDDDDRQPINMNTIANRDSIPVRAGNPRMSCINESGLYALILGSKKPEAQRFKKWVTSVVLPAIRKDGAYVAGEEKVAASNLDIGAANVRGRIGWSCPS